MPEAAILVTTDVVWLCPNIPHDFGSQPLRKRLHETGICKIPTGKMHFNGRVCSQKQIL